MEHRIFFLKSGQKPPNDGGSTGRALKVAPENRTGLVWKSDTVTWTRNDLTNRLMTAAEIAEYDKRQLTVSAATVQVGGKNYEILMPLEGDQFLVADKSLSPPPVFMVSFADMSVI